MEFESRDSRHRHTHYTANVVAGEDEGFKGHRKGSADATATVPLLKHWIANIHNKTLLGIFTGIASVLMLFSFFHLISFSSFLMGTLITFCLIATIPRGKLNLELAFQASAILLATGVIFIMSTIITEKVFSWKSLSPAKNSLLAILPVLLGTKCSVQMTLASRLGTAHHTGRLSVIGQDLENYVLGSIAIAQLQAFVTGFFLPIVMSIFAYLVGSSLSFSGFYLYNITVSMVTISVSTFFLSTLNVVFSLAVSRAGIPGKNFRPDPDVLVAPFISAVGEVVVVLVLSFATSIIWQLPWWFLYILILANIGLVYFCYLFAVGHPATAHVLRRGWLPLVGGTCIGIVSGLAVQHMLAEQLGGIVRLSPLLNGLAGNIAAMFACRASSHYHMQTKNAPVTTVISWKEPAVSKDTAHTLFVVATPCHVALYMIQSVLLGEDDTLAWLTTSFFVGYMITAVLQARLMLSAVRWLTNVCSRIALDPDTHVLPWVTNVADFIGSLFLFVFVHMRE